MKISHQNHIKFCEKDFYTYKINEKSLTMLPCQPPANAAVDREANVLGN